MARGEHSNNTNRYPKVRVVELTTQLRVLARRRARAWIQYATSARGLAMEVAATTSATPPHTQISPYPTSNPREKKRIPTWWHDLIPSLYP